VIIQVPTGYGSGPFQLKLNNGAVEGYPIVLEIEAQ
jgi:hypothetical protein